MWAIRDQQRDFPLPDDPRFEVRSGAAFDGVVPGGCTHGPTVPWGNSITLLVPDRFNHLSAANAVALAAGSSRPTD